MKREMCSTVYELKQALNFVDGECRLSYPVVVNYELVSGEGFMRVQTLAEPPDTGPVTPEWISERWDGRYFADGNVWYSDACGKYYFKSGNYVFGGEFIHIESRAHFAELARVLRFREKT